MKNATTAACDNVTLPINVYNIITDIKRKGQPRLISILETEIIFPEHNHAGADYRFYPN